MAPEVAGNSIFVHGDRLAGVGGAWQGVRWRRGRGGVNDVI